MIDFKSIQAYHLRREAALRQFRNRRHGTQAAASKDLRIAASMVSSVLRGKYVDDKTLSLLEGWLDEHPEQPAFFASHDQPTDFIN